MGLDEYKKKRDFGKTPEPAGEVRGEGGSRFVIQKHHARNLHYDLRLEMEGVLKSWAVPKGPSLDPDEKRLAIHVEDHPLDYFDFEGVIPAGEYGAGKVIVWDQGIFACGGRELDPLKSLERGMIDLILYGEKLKGRWVLVRTHRQQNQWLFFKKQDEFADPTRDILTDSAASVISGLEIEEVDESTSRTWNTRLHRLMEGMQAPLGEIDEAVRPMVATLVDSVPSGKEWVYQLKYDGIRALAEKKTVNFGSTHVT